MTHGLAQIHVKEVVLDLAQDLALVEVLEVLRLVVVDVIPVPMVAPMDVLDNAQVNVKGLARHLAPGIALMLVIASVPLVEVDAKALQRVQFQVNNINSIKKMDKNKLYNRRAFFKKAAQTTLPIIAFAAFGNLLTSCKRDEPDHSDPSSCNGSCKGNCYGSCSGSCTGGSNMNSGCGSYNCSSTCEGSCSNGCLGGCAGGCYGKCEGSCTASCTGGCKNGCEDWCRNSCSGKCDKKVR